MESPVYFEEQWRYITRKSVPDICSETAYMISDLGNVWSNLSNSFLKPTITNCGYYRVCLVLENGARRYKSIHRILLIEFDPINNYQKLQVNHFNGDKSYNKIWNLEWTTASQNIQHAINTGLKVIPYGENSSCAQITNEQAEQIAQLITEQKYTYQEIANIVGCTLPIVNKIVQGSTWKHIYNKYDLQRFNKQFVLRLSDEDLHKLCKYFEDHKNINYRFKSDLYRNALKELFNIEYTQNMTATLSRLYNKQTRQDITGLYNF